MKNERPDDNLYWMLLQIAFRAKHGLMKLAEKHDLTVVQLHTLCVMNPGESIPMNTLSSTLLCDASNVTGIIDRLLSQGYVARVEKPGDRRVKMLTLTTSGESLRRILLKALLDYELPELRCLRDDQRATLKLLLVSTLYPHAHHEL